MEERKLINLILKMEVVEFIGLAKLLGVSIIEKDEPIPFTDVLDNILIKFHQLNSKKKKEIIKLIEKSNHKRGGANASNS